MGDNILKSIGRPAGLMIAVDLLVVLHVAAAFHVFTHPIFDLLERRLAVMYRWVGFVGFNPLECRLTAMHRWVGFCELKLWI